MGSEGARGGGESNDHRYKNWKCQHQRSDWWFSLSRDVMIRGLYEGDIRVKQLLAVFLRVNISKKFKPSQIVKISYSCR